MNIGLAYDITMQSPVTNDTCKHRKTDTNSGTIRALVAQAKNTHFPIMPLHETLCQ